MATKETGFQLAALERLREWQRDERLAALHEVENQCAALEREAAEAAASVMQAQAGFRRVVESGSSLIASWAVLHDYTRAQSAAIATKNKRIDELGQLREQKAAELGDATAALKAVGKLRERKAASAQVAGQLDAYRQIEENWQILAQRKPARGDSA